LAVLVPIALSRFTWSSLILQKWARTDMARDIANRAASQFPDSRTPQQGLLLLVVLVLIHYYLWEIPPRTPCRVQPRGLIMDFTRQGYLLLLEALDTYTDLFGLGDVLADHPSFCRIQHIQVEIPADRREQSKVYWSEHIPTALSPRHDEICSGKESAPVGTVEAWYYRLGLGFWSVCHCGDD
jgi:hypothetical protein